MYNIIIETEGINRRQYVEEQLAACDAETKATIEALGFDMRHLADLVLMHAATDIEALARDKGYAASPDTRLGTRGQTKTAYRQPDGRVLKLQPPSTFIAARLSGEDELSFQEEIRRKLGRETDLILARSDRAAPGVPGTLQEEVFPTQKALIIARSAGDEGLMKLLMQAHTQNPLAKYYIFEQKIRNSGLVLRGDKLYVVAFDTADGVCTEYVEEHGGWEAVQRDMADIVPINPAQLRAHPELTGWVERMAQAR